MRKSFGVLLAAILAVAFAALPAAAHTGVMPGRIAPDSSQESELVIAHGCGVDGTVPGADDETFGTTAITLEVPDEVEVEPHEADGWELVADRNGDGRVTQARWIHPEADGTLDAIRFGLDITVPDLADGTQLWLPVVQDCAEGERMSWTHPGVEYVDGAQPASSLTITDPELAASAQTGDGGVPTPVLVALVVAIAVLGGGAAFVITGRRG